MVKEIVGLVEEVKIIGKRTLASLAVFDSGATSTSVDLELASKAGLGPVTKVTRIRNPSMKGRVRRPVVKAKIEIKGRVFETEVNLQDRSHMKFPVIIGRNILAGNFLVDPQRNSGLFKKGIGL